MGVGYFLLPIILLPFYIIPIGLFFFKSIKKRIRQILLLIPIAFTIFFIIVAIVSTQKTNALYKKYPQANELIFKDNNISVRDSILCLQELMDKLPKLSNIRVSYALEKWPNNYNYFTFNRYKIGDFNALIVDSVLRSYQVPDSIRTDWIRYIGNDLTPFDTLSQSESRRFIELIKYLDSNSLSAAVMINGKIRMTYNDSLTIYAHTGFRTVILDTVGYSDLNEYYIFDEKDGLFLINDRN